MRWQGIQARGQLIMSRLPLAPTAAAMASASSSVAAKGFSTKRWAPKGATRAVHSPCFAEAGQSTTTSGRVSSRQRSTSV